MNSVQLVGRLTKDVEVYNGTSTVAKFTVAVDRRYSKDGDRQADFITCVAFGKTAEFVENYFGKGQRIGLNGRIQTGSYEKEDGTKVFTTDVVVENCEFVESKGQSQSQKPISAPSDGFVNIEIEDELPF